MTRLLTIVCLGLTLAGTAFAGQRGFIPKDNGGTINSDGSVPLSFYGHATTTQQTVNAAASTNSAATVTVYTYSLSATAAVTNRTLQTVTFTNAFNGVTNVIIAVTNVVLQTGVADSLSTPTTNTVTGAGLTLVNQLRAALVNLGLVK